MATIIPTITRKPTNLPRMVLIFSNANTNLQIQSFLSVDYIIFTHKFLLKSDLPKTRNRQLTCSSSWGWMVYREPLDILSKSLYHINYNNSSLHSLACLHHKQQWLQCFFHLNHNLILLIILTSQFISLIVFI